MTSHTDYSGNFKDYAENVGTGWRTLSLADWLFLFQRNTTSRVCYAKAVVNGVNGVILLPDNWDPCSAVAATLG